MTETAPHHNEVKAFDVCSSCGAARKDRAAKCDFCKADHTSQALTPPRFDDELWVQIETTFQCRACGFSVPLNHLEMTGAVVCGKCGAEQAFDVKGWHEAFDFAHSTADFGPGKSGWGKATFDGGNQFTILTVAGHPLCETCHGLLAFTADNGKADVSCGACKKVVSYITPERAVKMTHDTLRAVIAPDHRADHKEVRVDETGAAVAIHCPQCQAPLDASQGTKFVHCKYCNTSSRIPDDVWFRVNGNDPKPTPIWLAFSGMSPERRLELKKKMDEQKSLAREREIEEEKQARALKHAHEEAVHEERVAHKKQLDEESAAKSKAIQKAKESRQATIVVLAIVGVSIVLAFIAVFAVSPSVWGIQVKGDDPAPTHEPTPTRAPIVTPLPPATHALPVRPTPTHHH